jgi:hypothetical protein
MAVLVSWLVGNGNCGGWIAAGMRFDVKTRELELRAGDAGTLLPTTFEGERLSSMLAAAEDVDSGAWPLQVGRVVWARLHVPRFTVRYTWRVPAGMVHPVHSFEQCDNEELAERAAQWAVRNRLGACGLLVTEVSVREGSTAWQLVAASQDAATDVDEPVELDRHSTETTSRPTVGRVVRPSVRTGRH